MRGEKRHLQSNICQYDQQVFLPISSVASSVYLSPPRTVPARRNAASSSEAARAAAALERRRRPRSWDAPPAAAGSTLLLSSPRSLHAAARQFPLAPPSRWLTERRTLAKTGWTRFSWLELGPARSNENEYLKLHYLRF